MFPRQDVGAKGSSPVQEPLRQPVFAEVRLGHYGNLSFLMFRRFYWLYLTYEIGKHSDSHYSGRFETKNLYK